MLGPATLVTLTVAGEAKGVLTKDDLLAGVVQELGGWGLSVPASTIDAGGTLYNAVTFQWLHYQYRAVLTVSTPANTFESVDDVAEAVRSVFEDIAGSSPTALQSTITATAPRIDAPAGGSWLGDIAGAVSGDLHGLLLIVVALVVLLVVALGWGKNTGRLAAALR